jgi:hypothetical protein
MGRYYSGDIEGKFWFGVQSSDDADHFGVAGEPRYLCYYFDEDNLSDIEEGIARCEDALGENKARLDAFFKEHDMYNPDMIINHYASKYATKIDDNDVKQMLKSYARLGLGKEILECVKEQGSCNFEAEL